MCMCSQILMTMSSNSYQQLLTAANSHECLDDNVIHPWNHEWIDITKEFVGACRGMFIIRLVVFRYANLDLALGELVKDERYMIDVDCILFHIYV